MGKEAKTNAMRMLDRKKVKYEALKPKMAFYRHKMPEE